MAATRQMRREKQQRCVVSTSLHGSTSKQATVHHTHSEDIATLATTMIVLRQCTYHAHVEFEQLAERTRTEAEQACPS